jgi:hypothetical protein
MTNDGLPIQRTGSWTFRLQSGQTLQLHITTEQGMSDAFHIDGHDISVLLDYLYDHREFIYEATHDQARRRLEALEARNRLLASQREGQPVKPILYFDDGKQRIRAQ